MYKINPFEFSYFSLDKKEKKIFSKTEITICEGEFVLLAGPSGGGKSTVLSLLKGLMPEFIAGTLTGDILYNGHCLNGENFYKNLKEIIYLFQNPFSWAIHQKTDDEFYFAMENFKFSHDEMLKAKEEFGNAFNLNNVWNRKTSELSHGECQKLALASLLAIGPRVLLLDEPTAFLDSTKRADFYKMVESLRGKFTIVLVDHHLDQIPLPDKILLVSKSGELTESVEKDAKNIFFTPSKMLSPVIFKSTSTIQLQAKKLCFSYNPQKEVLKNIDLKLSSGDIVVITGDNGEGKSTLFKVLSGILKVNSGDLQITKDAIEIKRKNYSKHIGFVFQNPESHFCFDTIKEELEFSLGTNEKNKIFDLAAEMLSGIDFNKSPFALSEGQKRRLSILITVMQNKEIVLFDEPTFGQDPESVKNIVNIIKDLKESGKIQLIISHDSDFYSTINAKIYKLKNGFLELEQ